MEKLIQLIKYFPLMPAAKETGKLILAICSICSFLASWHQLWTAF